MIVTPLHLLSNLKACRSYFPIAKKLGKSVFFARIKVYICKMGFENKF